eukprot:UN09281
MEKLLNYHIANQSEKDNQDVMLATSLYEKQLLMVKNEMLMNENRQLQEKIGEIDMQLEGMTYYADHKNEECMLAQAEKLKVVLDLENEKKT